MLYNASNQMNEFKKEVDVLKDDIRLANTTLMNQIEESSKIINPTISTDYNILVNSIQRQKHENCQLIMQISELEKEKFQMQQQIIAFQSRIQLLEEQLGH